MLSSTILSQISEMFCLVSCFLFFKLVTLLRGMAEIFNAWKRCMIYIYIYIYIYAYVYSIYIYICVYIYIYMHMYIVYIYICVYIYIYAYVYSMYHKRCLYFVVIMTTSYTNNYVMITCIFWAFL